MSESVNVPQVFRLRGGKITVVPGLISVTATVAGVTFVNASGERRQRILATCLEGDAISLVRERGNSYDANAIAVMLENGKQIGYVPGRIAGKIARLFDNEQIVSCEGRIERILGGKGSNLGAGITVHLCL